MKIGFNVKNAFYSLNFAGNICCELRIYTAYIDVMLNVAWVCVQFSALCVKTTRMLKYGMLHTI